MLYIKKFIDKVSLMESKMNKDLVVSMTDARGLRDELSKLLTDLHDLQTNKSKDSNEVIQVEIVGGKFK
jgi:hypothetical protein